MDRPEEPPAATEQPKASAALIVRPSMALAEKVGRSVQRWIPGLGRLRGGLRQCRDRLLRHPMADELERSRRENEQLQNLLAELPEIFERKYQQRLEPLLEHQYRLLEDNALLMDQLRLLQGSPAPDMQPLVAAESLVSASVAPAASPEPPSPAMATDHVVDPSGEPEEFQNVPPSRKDSVHLDGVAPLADVSSLLQSLPWGLRAPSLIPVPPQDSPPQPEAAEPAAADPEPVALPSERTFEELVSLAASEQAQLAPFSEDPGAPLSTFPAPEPWIVEPEPLAVEPLVVAASPWLEPAVAGVGELLDSPGQADVPVDLDPLEQARARKLQAWRRARRQSGG